MNPVLPSKHPQHSSQRPSPHPPRARSTMTRIFPTTDRIRDDPIPNTIQKPPTSRPLRGPHKIPRTATLKNIQLRLHKPSSLLYQRVTPSTEVCGLALATRDRAGCARSGAPARIHAEVSRGAPFADEVGMAAFAAARLLARLQASVMCWA
jgi:hypothetical protein